MRGGSHKGPQALNPKNTSLNEVHRAPQSTVTEVDLCEEGTIKKFYNAVEQNVEPLNCLDVPQVAGAAPDIIR